ncbi:MAG: cellulase family glycosylhydrolase, partial [Solirubrobacterales bacterium]|nr:cellulase family glycosylhydrolase [Solirubrobacterales bacterium]
DPSAPPRDDPDIVQAFAEHVAFVARRWPEALGIETWNEPNADFAWRNPNPVRYARLHRAAAEAVDEVDSEMAVVVGGLAGNAGADVMGPQRYLKGLYAAGLRPSDYDALALHPYPGQADGRMSALGAGSGFARVFADFRAGFRSEDPGAAVWVTEVGLSTTGAVPLSHHAQAQGLTRLTRRILTMPDVEALFLHTQYDVPGLPPQDGERGFGVLVPRGQAVGSPKAAFCALRDMATDPPFFAGCP